MTESQTENKARALINKYETDKEKEVYLLNLEVWCIIIRVLFFFTDPLYFLRNSKNNRILKKPHKYVIPVRSFEYNFLVFLILGDIRILYVRKPPDINNN